MKKIRLVRYCDHCRKPIPFHNKTGYCSICGGALHSMRRLKTNEVLYQHIKKFMARKYK